MMETNEEIKRRHEGTLKTAIGNLMEARSKIEQYKEIAASCIKAVVDKVDVLKIANLKEKNDCSFIIGDLHIKLYKKTPERVSGVTPEPTYEVHITKLPRIE